uniref:Uncharacterized protein n=1 Tax=Solanum lycopersicum TaxID=4081 RepID=A0A3Q7IHW7_SOLLC
MREVHEITGAPSSGIFMEILFIVVVSPLKNTTHPFWVDIGRPTIDGRIQKANIAPPPELVVSGGVLMKPTLDMSNSEKKAMSGSMKGERCDRGRKMFSEIDIFFSSKMKKADDGLRCILCEGNTFFLPPWYDYQDLSLKSSGVHVAAVSAPFLVKGTQLVQHLLEKRESSSDNHISTRKRVEWLREDLFGYVIQLKLIDELDICILHNFSIWKTLVKYIADLGALCKTNPIFAITFTITTHMMDYPPTSGFGAYLLALVGVVTSVIGRWVVGRFPLVSKFGGPKAVLRAPDT